MAQLRHQHNRFIERDAQIIVVGPDDKEAFADYWEKENLPFIGLPDPNHTVLKLYGQEIKWFKLGRMPAQVVVDKTGQARYAHYSNSMRDIPRNDEILTLLDRLTWSP